MLTYLLIRTKHGKNRIAYDKLLKNQELVDLHEVFGRYDIIGLVETKDLEELRTFIQNKVWIIEQLDKVETLVVSNLQDYSHNNSNVEEITHTIDSVSAIKEDEPEVDDDGQFLPP